MRCFNEKFTNDYLLVFCEQLAIFRNQKFTLKTPKLNTSLPYIQIRINALTLALLLVLIFLSISEYLAISSLKLTLLN
ncbi:hypothetical protein VN0963_11860 [Helicobacter pylori]